ncbi:hypothetical protein [Mycobacteroides chelonae]|uniref:hypothetical protein n=1 Tax=Mycobacteroides chelonae TaxID=1774 RepID=UPI0012FF7CA9|nr:hypothetical protein [Mycobacteroides chelonae]
MSMLSRLRDLTAATPEPEPEPAPDPVPFVGCKCEPAPFDRGPRFGGHVAARGYGLPHDPGLRVL